ncbi:uncharacterized protein LOC125231822 isoform X1 [Leguminivora glycinivorella]|uniref:uncharacterized protein LOC125231822 isoform X1 n=1 Tax=Leguminivora glycinivorella TaxID=1035111 RepID=UPI00200E90FC|nr:uncharacterized protein LOC125231822 isoform X1 [Leguminivora glycinivorella]XP_047993359.1 uncharacterized protein LOC125231822 isoform X1 [Leguminivora glycinivorella]
MLLIWLLLIPSAACVVCKTACDLCAMSTRKETAACALCRDCKRSGSRPSKDLRELEKLEFKQVMKEYGLKPEDLIDTDEDLKQEPNEEQHTYDENLQEVQEVQENQEKTKSTKKFNRTTTTIDPRACLGELLCYDVNDSTEEDFSGKLLKKEINGKKKKCRSICSPGFTPKRLRPRSTTCPPVTPCLKTLKRVTQKMFFTRSTLPPFEFITSNIQKDYDLNDQACPTQPSCSDDEDNDYEIPVTTRGPVSRPKITRKTCCPKELLKLLSTPLLPCMPCMPVCQVPCGGVSQSTQTPSVTTYTPEDSNESFITIKPMTAKITPLVNSDENKILSKEEINTAPSVFTEETTKDYLYVYVGVPKDVNNIRKG